MFWQGLHFEVILTSHLYGLRWSSGRASRDMLLQLGHMEDIVDLLEPTLKSMYHPSYAFHYPERFHIPRSKLPSTCRMESLRGQ